MTGTREPGKVNLDAIQLQPGRNYLFANTGDMATETITAAAGAATPAEKLQLRAETSLNYEKEEVMSQIRLFYILAKVSFQW